MTGAGVGGDGVGGDGVVGDGVVGDGGGTEVVEVVEAGIAGPVLAGQLRILVVTVSTRAAAGVYEDRSGPVLAAGLRDFGAAVDGPRVVPDGGAVEGVLRAGAADGYDVIVTTGGTGFTPDDRTPEMTRRVLDLEIPGIAEALRATGVAAGVPTALFSRGLAGLVGSTFVVNLPGSTGAVRDGLSTLLPLLTEIVRHARGGSH